MAHEVENMFSVREIPWHKLGIILQDAPGIEEAIVAAGLNWEVGMKPLFTADQEAVPANATYRKSDGRILGVVGPDYSILQNSDAFKFFQPFLDSGEATLETAGSLRNGQRIWVLAKINRADSIIVPQADDRVAKYVLLSNSHDGTLAVRVGFTPVRVVCNNTMRLAHSDKASSLLRVRHTGDVSANLDKIREVMNLADAEFEATAEQYRLLASKQIVLSDLEKFVKIVFKAQTKVGHVETEAENSRVLPKIVNLFEHGRGNDLEGVKGTLWAAYNAVTEYTQYFRGKDDMTRLDQTWFGTGAALSKKALDTAVTMAQLAA